MNKRIKELLEQAGVKFVVMPNGTEYEKFAELLIRECADWIRTTDSDLDIGEEDARALLAHFGIEEPKGWICPKCNADRTKIACPLGFGATVDGRCPMVVTAQGVQE